MTARFPRINKKRAVIEGVNKLEVSTFPSLKRRGILLDSTFIHTFIDRAYSRFAITSALDPPSNPLIVFNRSNSLLEEKHLKRGTRLPRFFEVEGKVKRFHVFVVGFFAF